MQCDQLTSCSCHIFSSLMYVYRVLQSTFSGLWQDRLLWRRAAVQKQSFCLMARKQGKGRVSGTCSCPAGHLYHSHNDLLLSSGHYVPKHLVSLQIVLPLGMRAPAYSVGEWARKGGEGQITFKKESVRRPVGSDVLHLTQKFLLLLVHPHTPHSPKNVFNDCDLFLLLFFFHCRTRRITGLNSFLWFPTILCLWIRCQGIFLPSRSKSKMFPLSC